MSIQHLFTKTVLPNTISFKNTVSLDSVEKIIFFKETGLSGIWLAKQFRYSWDKLIWTNWDTLTQHALMEINFNNRPNFWLETRYTRENYTTATITDWYLFYEGLVVDSDPSILIDADLLQGKDGTWYLTRSNHVGPYTDLYMANLPLRDTSAGGVYSHKVDTSISTTHYFKSLIGSGGVAVTDVSDGDYNALQISIDVSVGGSSNIGDGDASVYSHAYGGTDFFRELKGTPTLLVSVSENIIQIDTSVAAGDYDTLLDPDLEMTSTVGGYDAGTKVSDLSGDSLITMWDSLLFPVAYPTLTAPSGSFSMSPTTILYEAGSNETLTFTSTLNRGSINPQYTADSAFRSGLPTSFNFTGTGLTDVSSNSIPYVHPAIDVSINVGSQSWSVIISYLGGVMPYDNKGNPASAWPSPDSSLAAGNLSASPTRTINGVYPLYFTTVDISILTKASLISMSTSTTSGYTLVTEAFGFRQAFDIPKAWTGLPLTAVQTYNTVSSSWEYQGGTAAASLTAWDDTSTSHFIQGVSTGYTRHAYNSDIRSSTQIRLLF